MDHSKWTTAALDQRSKALRRQILGVFQSGGCGHIGAAFSLVEILRVLYDDVLKFDSKNPKWLERDRFILSKGHGCLALYVMLFEKGFITQEDLNKFCDSDGILGGHPEHSIPGVEASTGSLGHGLSLGVGMALATRFDKRPSRVFVVMGDGESNEGSVWEAAMSASKHKLNHLAVLTDYNKYQSYSTTFEVMNLEPLADKWRSFGFDVIEVDGHDLKQLKQALENVGRKSEKPTSIICHTVKGRGVSFTENNLNWHHKNNYDPVEMSAALKELE